MPIGNFVAEQCVQLARATTWSICSNRTAISSSTLSSRTSQRYVLVSLDAHRLVVLTCADKPGAFDEAVKGVDAVAHTASPFHFQAEDPQGM